MIIRKGTEKVPLIFIKKYVNDLLAQIEGKDKDDKTGFPTGLAKVRADRAAADQNIANNNKTIAKYLKKM